MKYNYWVVVGDNEITTNTLSIESRSGEKFTMSTSDLIEKLKEEVVNKIN
jgi:threonyl-tRNA synthetase